MSGPAFNFAVSARFGCSRYSNPTPKSSGMSNWLKSPKVNQNGTSNEALAVIFSSIGMPTCTPMGSDMPLLLAPFLLKFRKPGSKVPATLIFPESRNSRRRVSWILNSKAE